MEKKAWNEISLQHHRRNIGKHQWGETFSVLQYKFLVQPGVDGPDTSKEHIKS